MHVRLLCFTCLPFAAVLRQRPGVVAVVTERGRRGKGPKMKTQEMWKKIEELAKMKDPWLSSRRMPDKDLDLRMAGRHRS